VIKDFKDLGVTERETYYSFLILLGHNTAYKIYSEVRKEKTISYKNVHERVKKLSDLKLISFKSYGQRGAKVYKLTSMGLFHVIKSVPVLSDYLVEYKENVILQFLLFRFFEPETVRYFISPYAIISLSNYLSLSCNELLKKMEEFQLSKRSDKHESLPEEIEHIVKKNIKSLIHTILSSSSARKMKIIMHNNKTSYDGTTIDLESLPGKLKGDPNYSYLFPRQSLKEDQKFITLLKEIKQEFDEGYKQFMS